MSKDNKKELKKINAEQNNGETGVTLNRIKLT